jgi:hypothetical protein
MNTSIVTKQTIKLDDIHYDKENNFVYGKGCLKQPVVCLRPAHLSGKPQIYTEEKFNKIISHNYGHGGSGYSLLFGSVGKCIKEFLSFNNIRNKINYNGEITVIGLGCIGLVTALKLYFKGFKNIKLVGENFINTPSFFAGGLIEINLDYDNNNLEDLNEMLKITFQEYQKISTNKHEFINNCGIKEIDYYDDVHQENIGLDYLCKLGIIPEIKKVLLKFGENNPYVREFYHFRTFNIISDTFMNNLMRICKNLRIPIEYKKISSFSEIESSVIFNCSGLGSRELNNDRNVYPICGHGIILNDNSFSEIDYIMSVSNIPELKNYNYDGKLYFMPKISGFIGGTFVSNYDGKDNKFNNQEIASLLARAKFIFQGVKAAPRAKF